MPTANVSLKSKTHFVALKKALQPRQPVFVFNITPILKARRRLKEKTVNQFYFRSLKQMQSQLSLERTLKLDAFDRVDNLQAQVLDTERETAFIASSRPTSASISK